MGRLSNWFLSILERWGAKIHVYAWNKRWGKRNWIRYQGSRTGFLYTLRKK
jgi:hypothetical protein